MRLLLEPKADAIMDYINDILLDRKRNPFLYEPINCRILSGEEEGAFAWMSVNYLRGYFSNTGTAPSTLTHTPCTHTPTHPECQLPQMAHTHTPQGIG